jgi:hypothetical protein
VLQEKGLPRPVDLEEIRSVELGEREDPSAKLFNLLTEYIIFFIIQNKVKLDLASVNRPVKAHHHGLRAAHFQAANHMQYPQLIHLTSKRIQS